MESLSFFYNNWALFLIGIGIILPVIPPEWLGIYEYYDPVAKIMRKQRRQSLLRFVVQSILSPLLELIIFVGFRGTVTIVIFVTVGIDLYFRRALSREAVILSGIGIGALYFEQLLEKAEEISVWKIFNWKAKSTLAQPQKAIRPSKKK